MIPETVRDFRQDYRASEIAGSYSGWRHFAFTFVGCVAIILWCVSALGEVSAWEWLTVPLTFLYANLSEWLGHRGPMHKPMRPVAILYKRHTLQHHRFFTHEAMLYEGSRDFHAVLFPPMLLVFFTVCFALPVGLLVWWLVSANAALLFVAISLAYFLNYELLHFAYHLDPASWAGRLPGMATLRHHHTVHHDPRLMNSYNFNITYPISDWLFGTWYRGGAGETGGTDQT